MNKFDKIEVSKFDYNLSEDKIAKYPLFDRDQSKLLIYDKGKISDDKFYNIPNYIDDDSLLIFNNTRVIHARLIFSKETGASIEIFCLMPYAPPDYNLSFVQRSSCIWRCMVGNLKKWKGEDLVKTVKTPKGEHKLNTRLLEKENNTALIKFFWDDDHVTFAELVEAGGVIPIPPYLNRKSEALDKSRYQTVYSKQKGSVATPTAGLHFTDNVMKGINQKKVTSVEVTLHVGAGTFTPVKSGNVSSHEMHQEYFCVPAETIKFLMSGKKIIPVGTTS